MKRIIFLILLFTNAFLVGCAGIPQAPVSLSENFYSNNSQTIGVYLAPLPKPNTFFPGADCLLCIAVVEGMNSSLTSHIQTLNVNDLENLDTELVKLLSNHSTDVHLIKSTIDIEKLEDFETEALNFSDKDHRPLKATLGIDKLAYINIYTAGSTRQYNAYVPIEPPTGSLYGKVYLIDLKTNKYDLYDDLSFKINVQGEWDEPPAFPGVTNAFYQAIESARNNVLTSFR